MHFICPSIRVRPYVIQLVVLLYQSVEWIGSIRWIHNPVQSRRIWIGLDQKFTN